MDAYIFFEEKRTDLGEEFLHHLEAYFDRITKNPKHFPEKGQPYLEAFIKRFPFLIIYEIINESVIVYSVFNTSRSTRNKKL